MNTYRLTLTIDVHDQYDRLFTQTAVLTFACASWAAKGKAERMRDRYTRELIEQNGYKLAMATHRVEWIGEAR